MGGRLSKPKGADGMSEASASSSSSSPALTRGRGIINGRVCTFPTVPIGFLMLIYQSTLMAPLAALTMAGLLFVYTRTSIRAAKLNAKKHREADGGQISWQRESMRRHGIIEKVEDDRSTIREALAADLGPKNRRKDEASKQATQERSSNDEELRKITGKRN